MNALGIENVKVCLNTLGSKEARNAYVPALKEYFAPHLEEMCPDCKVRFEKNPLRMLDCKADANTDIMNNVPRISDYLTEEDKGYFEDLKNALDALGIKYEVSDKLVRGLDYYSNDVFELIYDNPESAINGLTLCAGGRYNDMGRDFDGPDVKAIGFAFGVERLMMALDELGIKVPNTSKDKVTVITLGKPVKQVGLKLVDYLRTNDIPAEIDYQSDNLKPQFKLAERIKARYIIIIGEDEVANNIMTIKDTVEQKEVKIKVDELNNYFNIKGDKNYAY
jgi:histidyl-tRNA synthetase